jgi:hypothetical protein
LRADRGQEDETLGACPLRRAGKPDRGLGIEHAIIVLGQSGHRVGDAGRMDDRIGVGEGGRHVLRPRQVTDDGARRLHRNGARPPQQHAQPITPLRQLAQQPLTDETGRPGERDQRFDADRIHRWSGPFDGCVSLPHQYIAFGCHGLRHR